MSVLQTPRILFKGEISWDPITTNNYPESNPLSVNNESGYYDENTDQNVYPTTTDRVKAFRQLAIDTVSSEGNWNPHGTYRSSFFDTAVSGVDMGAGVTRDDPFVNANASFRGMLVDLEPYGAFSSQLFFDELQLGVSGGYSLRCARRWRMTDRYVNFMRNPTNNMIAGVASVVWQTSFPRELVRLQPFDSPALKALAAALEGPGVLGLTVRFNTYRTVYYDNPRLSNGSPLTSQAAQALMAKLNTGGFQPNPARSLLVGVVGLWRQGEPIHEPGDRALLPAGKVPSVATAHARVEGTSLTLDLSNSIAMTNRDCRMADLGTLAVAAINPSTGVSTALGSIPYSAYDTAAFEASSGMVTLPLTQAQAQAASAGNLLVQDGIGNVKLQEAPLRAIPETPNVYLDYTDTARVAFRVYERGAPVAGERDLTLYQMSADGSTIISTTNVRTDAEGVYAFTVSGASAGPPPAGSNTPGSITAYVAAPDASQAPSSNGINPLVNTYAYVRILAADNAIATLAPTWENVYQNVLCTWNALAPCMDNWLRLDDPEQVKAYAPVLKRLTDPSFFESYLYMPVTRDLTAGGRALLYAFLDAPTQPGPALSAAADTEEPPDYAKLSRAMRRPR